jgi:hypothetical protein
MSAPFVTGLMGLAYGKYGPVLRGRNAKRYFDYIATDIAPEGKDIENGMGVLYVAKMLDTDPCDVPGIDCDGGDEPDEPGDEPNEPGDEPIFSGVKFDGENYVIRWRRQSEREFRILQVPSVIVVGNGEGDQAAAYDQIKRFVDSYPNNRAIVLTDEMGFASATHWFGQFLIYAAKNSGVDLTVEKVVGRDEQGRVFIASNFDKNAVNETMVRMIELDLPPEEYDQDKPKNRFLVRARWAVENKIGGGSVPEIEFDDEVGVYFTFIYSDRLRPSRDEIVKVKPFKDAILKQILTIEKQ